MGTENDPASDDYVPPWRRGTVTLSSDGPGPAFNAHLPQLKPRTTQRPAALDEAIERERNKPRVRPSGHSLIR